MTLTDSEQLAELVVPDSDFAALSARGDQAEMVAELNSCYAMNVSSSYTSQHLATVVLLCVNEVPGTVSIDQLVHLVFPNKDHVDDLTLERHSGLERCYLVPISIATRCHRWRTFGQVGRRRLLIDIHPGDESPTAIRRRVETLSRKHLLRDRAGRRWRLL